MKRRTYSLLFAGLLLLITTLIGCSGRGVPDSHARQETSSSTQILQPASTRTGQKIREYQAGDRWTYTVDGQVSETNGRTLKAAGTYQVSIVQASLQGKPVLAQSLTISLVLSDGRHIAQNHLMYFAQDNDSGDVTTLGFNEGSNDADRIVVQPQVTMPGTLSARYAKSYNLMLDSGETIRKTTNVTGSEMVSSLGGRVAAWKMDITSTDSKNGLTTGTQWWVPELGSPVKGTLSTSKENSSLTLTLTLTATNVPK